MSKYESKELSKENVDKFIKIVNKGLIGGVGHHTSGKICIEQAVSKVFNIKNPMNLSLTDTPTCINSKLTQFMIAINDSGVWGSEKQRANGMRRLAVAHLGTAGAFNSSEFKNYINTAFKEYNRQYIQNKLNALTKKQKNLSVKEFTNEIYGISSSIYEDKEHHTIDAFDQDFVFTGGDGSNIEQIIYMIEDPKILADFCDDIAGILELMNTPGSAFLEMLKPVKRRSSLPIPCFLEKKVSE